MQKQYHCTLCAKPAEHACGLCLATPYCGTTCYAADRANHAAHCDALVGIKISGRQLNDPDGYGLREFPVPNAGQLADRLRTGAAHVPAPFVRLEARKPRKIPVKQCFLIDDSTIVNVRTQILPALEAANPQLTWAVISPEYPDLPSLDGPVVYIQHGPRRFKSSEYYKKAHKIYQANS